MKTKTLPNYRTQPDAPAGAGTQSIERAVRLLRAVAHLNEQGASVAEVSAHVELDRTTVHRMLKCLASEGMLKHAGEPRRYFLGPLTYQLGVTAAEKLDLRKICAPSMQRIAADTGDTVFLMVREGHDSVCADRQSGSFPVKSLVVEVGNRRPLGVGAGSLAILAALPEPEADASLVANEERVSAYRGMSVQTLKVLARRSRALQRATMDVIGVEGVRAIAVPIRDGTGAPVAAFSIAAIGPRMTTARQQELFAVLEREATLVRTRLEAEQQASYQGNQLQAGPK